MATLLKRSASPSMLQNNARKKPNLSNSSVVPCSQQFCKCNQISNLLVSNVGQDYVLHLNEVEISNFYIKYNSDEFVPIYCFLNIVSEFIRIQVSKNELDFGTLLSILHPNLTSNQQFIGLLQKYDIFSKLEREVVESPLQYNGNYSTSSSRTKSSTDIVLALKSIHWFAVASPGALFQSPKLLTKLTEFINVFIDEINEVTLQSIQILCELSRRSPQLTPVITESSHNQDLLDILTKNIAMSSNAKNDFFYGNVYLFKQCMQHKSHQVRAAEFGYIELLLTIYEYKWDTDFFEIISSVLSKPIYCSKENSDPTTTNNNNKNNNSNNNNDSDPAVSASEIILRNEPFLHQSWKISANNKLNFISVLKNIKFRTSKEEIFIEGLIGTIEV
ncbi:hypothetical protein CLIB1423_30S00738 [[Candida] railenensis]|uniref:Uncharacterized protein n=1 Tax=[Candida] railenensis TaxID=45579 RepID=A0A9P0QWK1_9ASCO|nr:hypothetical protein CLIB1423_30S00738 [[Candida] railenensis]